LDRLAELGNLQFKHDFLSCDNVKSVLIETSKKKWSRRSLNFIRLN